MKLRTGIDYTFTILKDQVPTICKLSVFVEPRQGKLDGETGEVISREDLFSAIKDGLEGIENKEWSEIKHLKFLPKTLEILVMKVWDLLEETIPLYAKLTHVKLVNDLYMVEYKAKTPYHSARNYEQMLED